MQVPGQAKPSSSGRARKRTIEDFEEEDMYQPTNGRKRYRVSSLVSDCAHQSQLPCLLQQSRSCRDICGGQKSDQVRIDLSATS